MELLNELWGTAPGRRCIGYKPGGRDKKGWRNKFFETNEEAYNFAVSENASDKDVYFAIALFDESGSRKADNVLTLNAFYIDLDVDADDPKKFPSIAEANEALIALTTALNLPRPTMVLSGYGLHCYWLLDQRIPRDVWQVSNDALANACIKLKIKADPQCFESARVLRIPGTLNLKRLKDAVPEKAPVRLVDIAPRISFDDFARCVMPFVPNTAKRMANKVFEVKREFLPSDPNKIADGCAVIRDLRDTGGVNQDQGVWYHTLQVLNHCVDGQQVAHDWSSQYPAYNAELTQTKLDQAMEFDPTTCVKFASMASDICNACPHYGQITSPIKLGEIVPAITEPVIVELAVPQRKGVALADEIAIGKPDGYQVGDAGTFYVDDESGALEQLHKLPIWIAHISLLRDGTGARLLVRWKTEKGEVKEQAMDADILTKDEHLDKWMLLRSVTGYHPLKITALRFYLRAYYESLKAKLGTETAFEHFGYHRNGFIIGPTNLTVDGDFPVILSGRVKTDMLDGYGVAGELEEWAKATELIRDQSRYLPHQFAICSALGSVLLSPMKVAGGCVTSLAGETGTGKSAIAQFAVSAFGKWQTANVNLSTSTEKGIEAQWQTIHHMPVLFDEIHVAREFERDIQRICMDAANSNIAKKGAKDGGLQDTASNRFKLITLVTLNRRLMDLPMHVLDDAAKNRVVELWFQGEDRDSQGDVTDPHNTMDQETGDALVMAGQNNYGHAGRALILHALRHRDDLKDMGKQMRREFDEAKFPQDQRYKIWNLAAARLAGAAMEQLGIIRFDTKAACMYAFGELRTERKRVLSMSDRCIQGRAGWEREHQGQFTDYNTDKRFWNDLSRGLEVRGKIAGRYTVKDGKITELAIPATEFADYCEKRGINRKALEEWVVKIGGKVGKDVKMHAGASSGTTCYVLPAAGDRQDG